MINTAFVVLTWLVGLAATFGPVAVILGLIFAQAATVQIVGMIAKRFISCLWCIVTVVAVLMCVGSYWVGHWDAESDCRAGELAAQLRNARVDAENAKKAADVEFERANTIEAESNDQRTKDAAYIKALESRPACNLDDTDLGRMRDDKPRTGSKKPAASAR